MHIIRTMTLLLSSAFVMNASASTDPNSWVWVDSSEDINVSTAATHQEHYTRMGTPVRMSNINDQLNEFLLDGFYALVPEGKKVSSTLLENTFNNISVKPDFEGTVDVKVAF